MHVVAGSSLPIAVIIPTLNEQIRLPAALAAVARLADPGVRVIVADGGSSDETVVVVEHFGTSVLRDLPRGRGSQVAAALQFASEDVVLVLHADATLPVQAIEAIRVHLRNHPRCAGGCLGHRFESSRPIYRWIERWDEQRARRGRSFGDQAQFFRRFMLNRIGGYPGQALMEDVELARRIRRLGPAAYLNLPVLDSPRRFEASGVCRTLLTNAACRMTYRFAGRRACPTMYRWYYGQLWPRAGSCEAAVDTR